MSNSYLQQSLAFDKHLLAKSVKESQEPMVSLPQAFTLHNVQVVFNDEIDTNAKTKKQYFLRKSVADALVAAAKEFLKHDMLLKIEDAYRSLDIQRTKFLQEVAKFQEKFPTLSLKEVKAQANTYIAGIPLLAAHTAGAAIDVTLVHKDTLKSVDFGCAYHSLDETSITNYPNISMKAKKNRQLFKKVMERHGLVNYPFEYWHFSMGDVCAAYLNKEKNATYGPVNIDASGRIISYSAPRSLRTYFS